MSLLHSKPTNNFLSHFRIKAKLLTLAWNDLAFLYPPSSSPPVLFFIHPAPALLASLSLLTSRVLPPPGLCTYYFLCLEHASPGVHTICCLLSFKPLCKCHSSHWGPSSLPYVKYSQYKTGAPSVLFLFPLLSPFLSRLIFWDHMFIKCELHERRDILSLPTEGINKYLWNQCNSI